MGVRSYVFDSTSFLNLKFPSMLFGTCPATLWMRVAVMVTKLYHSAYFLDTANTAFGFVRAIASNVRAAPLGCLRPCSQP